MKVHLLDMAIKTISIHALRVEGDRSCTITPRYQIGFLSTPSVWRATVTQTLRLVQYDISIHALRVEGDAFGRLPLSTAGISIHALRVEGDT